LPRSSPVHLPSGTHPSLPGRPSGSQQRSARPRPGARGLTPPPSPARSPAPGAAPACTQLAPGIACSRRTVRPLPSAVRPRRVTRCSVHSPSLPGTRPSAAHPLHIFARGVLPARRSAWPGAARGGLAQAQLVAARCPGAARPPSWCAGCPTRPRPAHGVFARFALPPA
jgi:hypothetical protein